MAQMTFTADQKKAIETHGQNILVAAAAGSGKTRVLVERIISQVRSGMLSLDRVLVLTFTKAAAAEMRERIEAALNEEIAALAVGGGSASELHQRIGALERQRVLLTGADISTFHSFCQRLIQSHIDATDIPPNFRIASEQEISLLKNKVVEDLLEQEYQRAENGDSDGFLDFSDAYGGGRGRAAARRHSRPPCLFSQSALTRDMAAGTGAGERGYAILGAQRLFHPCE